MASILKVNPIQDATNSTTAMTIDSSGRVLTPAKPSFCAYEDSGGYQIDATNTIRYQTTTCNVGNHYNTSTYKFTAPIAGAYYFSFTAWTDSSALTRTGFFQNDTAVGNSSFPIGGRLKASSDMLNGGSCIVQMAVSDTMEVKVYAGSVNSFGSNYFLGYLIG